MSSRFGYAGSSLLPKVTLTDKNRLAWAILDSGASSHFLLTDAPVESKVIAKNPIEIRLPDGNEVKSSHDAVLDLPQLPKAARLAHIVPGLANHSLISVVKLCNAGCQVIMTDISCEVRYRGKTVVTCSKCTRTRSQIMRHLKLYKTTFDHKT